MTGCASLRPRHAVPMDLLDKAQISNIQDIRAFDGRPSNFLMEDFVKLLDQEEKEEKESAIWAANSSHTYCVLAISGGGDKGAYGVGLLNGWTREGSRPVFKVVTGVSTGAIIAPFAFLGSKYDERLKEFYTKYSTKEIMREKGLLQAILGNSYMSNHPLKHLIEQNIDQKLLSEIAREYNKGRRLYVGTTNLDAQQFVIWDMGKIASVGNYKALNLFRKIILASVSMPIVFPPVYFDVEVNHKMYDEMHTDGGVTKQVFLLYNVLQGFEKAIMIRGIDISKVKYKIYIIRNGYVDPVWGQVSDNIFSIAQRTFDTSTNAQGIGDLYQLYTFAKMGRGDFNLAYIPSTHIFKAKELFDLNEMRGLFDLGFKEALRGYDWKKVPPGLNEDVSD
jgi:predicted acylesterase/phospholipase RssA